MREKCSRVFFFQAEDGIRDGHVTGVQTCALPIYPLIGDETRKYFRDVDDHLARVREQVTGFDELLTSILAAGLAQVQVQENDDLRRISAWVAILALPTMVAC